MIATFGDCDWGGYCWWWWWWLQTCMIATLGPADWNYDETLSTLRYAVFITCLCGVYVSLCIVVLRALCEVSMCMY